ncbi:MAG: hypothetical protein ACQEVA_13150 [Myxococcota bacterium]
MTGYKHDLKADYSFLTEEGFARLEQMAGREVSYEPPNTGNVHEDIYEDAVYGGEADPDAPQEFVVYGLDWVEDTEGEGSAERAESRPIADIERHFDESFSGWVYNKHDSEVYALKDE